ncbi:MAG TPA: alpha/beta hydrolase [Patescibacteria group bacterium]
MEKRPFSPTENLPTNFGEVKVEKFSYDSQSGPIQGIRVRAEKIKDPQAVLYGPGWGATIMTHLSPIKQLAQRGYDVISITPPSTTNRKKDGFPSIEYAKGEAQVQALQKQFVTRASLVGHSEGCINVSIAALIALNHNIKIDSLVLVAPGGLIGKDRTGILIPRFFFNAAVEPRLTGEKGDRANAKLRRSEAIKTIVTNPILAFKEAQAIANTSLSDILKELHRRGVKIAVVQGDNDLVFPLEKMIPEAEKCGVDTFYEGPKGRGGHNGIVTQPESYTTQIVDALKRLSPKK